MKHISFVVLLFSLILSSCSQEELSKSKVQSRLKNLQELGTVEYTLRKVLAVDDTQWYSVGDRKVVISMKANMKAGVDFSKLNIQEFDNDTKSIKLQLPPAKVNLLDIQPEEIKYELVKVSMLRGDFSNEELNQIQVLGEKDIRSKIDELGILKEAEKNADTFIKSWLKMMGFENIEVVHA